MGILRVWDRMSLWAASDNPLLAALCGWCQTNVYSDVKTVPQDRAQKVCEKHHHPQSSWPSSPASTHILLPVCDWCPSLTLTDLSGQGWGGTTCVFPLLMALPEWRLREWE